MHLILAHHAAVDLVGGSVGRLRELAENVKNKSHLTGQVKRRGRRAQLPGRRAPPGDVDVGEVY